MFGGLPGFVGDRVTVPRRLGSYKGVTFDGFAQSVGPRLRAGLVAAYGPEVGAEAAATALAYAWENRSRVLEMANPAGYLYRVGQTAARRSRRPQGYLPVPETHDLPDFEPRLLPALEALTEHQRIAVVLVHGLGWSQVETAELLDVDPSTVRTHISRAIQSSALPWRSNPVSELDVIEQLARYGRWVEESTGLNLRATAREGARQNGHAPVVEILDVHTRRGRSPDRWSPTRVAGFAAALVVVALTGWILLRAESAPDQGIAAEATEDPRGPLFVLPARSDQISLANGHIALAPEKAPFRQMMVIGTVSDGGYSDLVTILVGQRILDAEGEPVELTSGPGELAEGFSTVVARKQGVDWISVIAGPDRAAEVIEVIEGLEVDDDGSVDADPGVGRRVIENAYLTDASRATYTYYEVKIDGFDQPVVIETATSPTPLVGGASLVIGEGMMTPAAGLPGWEASRDDPEGQWNGLAWQATPNRMIAVSGHVPRPELRAIAQSLEIVDEANWSQALPNHTVAEPRPHGG